MRKHMIVLSVCQAKSGKFEWHCDENSDMCDFFLPLLALGSRIDDLVGDLCSDMRKIGVQSLI